MKRTTLPTIMICLTLCASALALPIYASASLDAETNKIMEKEAPIDLMKELNTEGIQAKQNRDGSPAPERNTIFLSETRLDSLKEKAETALKETLGIEIPENTDVEYGTALHHGLVHVNLTWDCSMDENDSDIVRRDEKKIMADFVAEDILKSDTLTSLVIFNGYDVNKLTGLQTLGVKELKNEFGVTVPESYLVTSVIRVHFGNSDNSVITVYEKPTISVSLEWGKNMVIDMTRENAMFAYNVSFDNVNIVENTGQVVGLSNLEGQFNSDGSIIDAPEFTSEQQKTLQTRAETFLVKKGIEYGKLVRSFQTLNNMYFFFEGMTPDGPTSAHGVTVVVNSNLEVMEYGY